MINQLTIKIIIYFMNNLIILFNFDFKSFLITVNLNLILNEYKKNELKRYISWIGWKSSIS